MSSLFIHEPLHCATGGSELIAIDGQDGLSAQGISAQEAMWTTFAALPLAALAANKVLEQVLAGIGTRPAGAAAEDAAAPGDQAVEPASFRVTAAGSGRSGPAAPRSLSLLLKGAMDVFLGALLLILAAPCFLAIMIASKLGGGPIFFAHRRVGAGGRPFYCLKFRTMVVDADRVLEQALAQDPILAAEWHASRKLGRDPRVTSIGRFLRKTSLDELPQLINVLRRDMSLVGPRPIVENEVPLYGESIAQYYATRPGLTGLWQVSGRSTVSYGRRVELDTWYVNNWTIRRDLAVLLKTVPVVLCRQGAC